MAKFNSPKTIRTENRSGHAAYAMRDREKLVTQVLTSFFDEGKFYGDNSADMEKTIESVVRQDPEFVSRLAVFARREFNMRSVSHVLTAYLAHEPAGKPFVRDTIRGVTVRGDDVTEIMAFYLSKFGKPVPNALKKGINDVLAGFDEYTLAKYKGDGKAVKMRDLLCLCRPKPKNEAQAALWKRCLDGTLATPETWETKLSADGNSRESWEALIDGGKVGYMALLRNYRNILKAEPRNIEKVYERLSDPEAVKRSKQLPFRFLSAYKSVKDAAGSRALDVLEEAADASVGNIPTIPGTSVIAIDVSGSMHSRLSGKSDVQCAEISMLLGLIANRICENAVVYTFNDRIERLSVPKRTGLLFAASSLFRCGGGTDMYLPFREMLDKGIRADRIIILSDNECNSGLFHEPVQKIADKYRNASGCDIWVHAIDLLGYGTQQFHGRKTNIIAGWSEKVFDFIRLAEQGEGSLEKTISAYRW